MYVTTFEIIKEIHHRFTVRSVPYMDILKQPTCHKATKIKVNTQNFEIYNSSFFTVSKLYFVAL